MEMGIRFGPVTNGLRNSPTGSKDHYYDVLATTLVIASTGAMLIVGHEAPCPADSFKRGFMKAYWASRSMDLRVLLLTGSG
jgi:hypothetical protein